jgi:hypothetical protein
VPSRVAILIGVESAEIASEYSYREALAKQQSQLDVQQQLVRFRLSPIIMGKWRSISTSARLY